MFALALLGLAPALSGQPALKFEVASIKVATSGVNGVNGGCRGIDSVYSLKEQSSAPPLGRCVITDARLSHLIGIAFGTSMQQLKTGPDWIQRGDLRFDVQAKAEDPAKTTQKQLLTMLQNLLVERFQLKFHYETKEEPGFALTLGKNGPKLKASTADDQKVTFRGPNGTPVGKPGGPFMSMTAEKCSMATLAEILTAFGSAGQIVDRTGLTGKYDFTLTWDQENGPVLSSALRDQLGLVSKPEKVSVSTFIVDSAEKPTAN